VVYRALRNAAFRCRGSRLDWLSRPSSACFGGGEGCPPDQRH
jgi:hypothetical protein